MVHDQRAGASDAALYQSVIRAMSEGVIVLGQGGRIMDVNPSAERILGTERTVLIGRLATDPEVGFVDADGAPIPEERSPFARVAAGVGLCDERLSVRCRDGSFVKLSVNAAPVEGRPISVVTFCDVTRVDAIQAALTSERTHLKSIIELIPGVVFELLRQEGEDDRVTFLSERALSMLGVSASQVGGDTRDLAARVHPDDIADVVDAFAKSAAELSHVSVELRLRPREDWIWLRVDAIPERLERGVRWIGLILDITRDRALSDRFRRVARREAMGEMAAGLAHNINNLLAAILPNIEMAILDEPRTRLHLEDALQATRNAADLMSQMLGFARQELVDTAANAVEVVPLVEDAVRFCRRTFSSRIKVEAFLPDEPVFVNARTSNLQQIVLNLCINARDAIGDRAEPRIEVRLELAQRGAEVQLTVTDNGIGMAPDVARRLGEPFFTTKPPGQGTGLGLATVYGIVRDMGGSIAVHSTPGLGTRFTVRLPTVAAPERATPAVTPRARLSGKALVIDDERLVRAAFRRQLENAGLRVTEAADGAAGLELFDQGLDPDIILLDLAMPGLSGEQVLEALVARSARAPIVIVSGHRGPSLELAGAYKVLRKPIEGASLIDTVANALNGRQKFSAP